MSETCTFVEEKDFHLLNIITIAQDRLQANFVKILNRLAHHDRLIKENAALSLTNSNDLQDLKLLMSQKFEEKDKTLAVNLESLEESMAKIREEVDLERARIDENCSMIVSLETKEQNLKYQIEEQEGVRSLEIEKIKEQMKKMMLQIRSISNNLSTKESMSEVERIRQSISSLKMLLQKNEEKGKFMEFKLQKIEVMSQKAEKSQKNKESMLMKEVEDKIRQQIKVSEPTSNRHSEERELLKSSHSRGSSQLSQEERRPSYYLSNPTSTPGQQPAPNQKLMSQVNQKMDAIENKLSFLQDKVRQGLDAKGSVATKDNKNELMEKINQIKPELIKIWAKCDSIEDKSIHMERKVEEQGKTLQQLIDVQKESHFSKMEDKMKLFQTEFYTGLKELRSKIDGKVNVIDFEKVTKLMGEKLQVISEQLILKSEKLEVKKALLFLESKIKEIILVISEDEENERDALITKKQIKCISCDKEIDKFVGAISNIRGNWDNMPLKDHAPETLGRFGMTNYGSLAKKIKKLEGKDLPVLSGKKNKETTQSEYRAAS